MARANYLAQGRPDIQYATKELCRKMSDPGEEYMKRLKRLGRYLLGTPRTRLWYASEEKQHNVCIWTESNFAGCKRIRKSTSGGIAVIGTHCIKSWSTTQDVIALSSGEAELYALVKGACHGIVLRSLMKDFGQHVSLNIHTDASAAKGIVSRRGIGRVRHIEVSELWIQYLVR